MHMQRLKWIVGAVAMVALCGISSAQVTEYQENQELGMESPRREANRTRQ